MDGLEDGAVVTEVGAGRHPQPTNERGADVRDDVTVGHRKQRDVVVGRPRDEPVTEGVDAALLEPQLRVLAGREHARGLQEEAVGRPHHGRLVHHRDRAPPMAARIVERDGGRTLDRRHRKRLQRDAGVRRNDRAVALAHELAQALGGGVAHGKLDARVEILVVHAHHDQVGAVARLR